MLKASKREAHPKIRRRPQGQDFVGDYHVQAVLSPTRPQIIADKKIHADYRGWNSILSALISVLIRVHPRLLRSNNIVDTLVVHALNDACLVFRVSTLGVPELTR